MNVMSPAGTVAVLVLDSLRVDSFQKARTPNMDRLLPEQEARHSYATWTLPSHSCLLAGLMPFPRNHGQDAARIYSNDMKMWAHTLGGDSGKEELFHPHFRLAEVARACGFATYASMAMPILNRHCGFTSGFDVYEDSNAVTSLRLAAQLECAVFNLDPEKPNFVFINAGDTHYPYLMSPEGMPKVSGLHGAVRNSGGTGARFDADMLAAMHASQIEAVEQIDRQIDHFVAELPKPVRLFVLSDHGELFGEDGLFGHGPYAHPALLDVPYATGLIT